IEPDQGGFTSIVISHNLNDPLLELPEFESFYFDLNPSFPCPPPEPPDVKIRLEPDTAVINNFDVLNKEACFNSKEGVQIFLPFFTYPKDSPFILSFGSEDLVFDPGQMNSGIEINPKFSEDSRVR
ncbi:hypothetical protein Tco_1290963, partial [Tanacetum coccineum]